MDQDRIIDYSLEEAVKMPAIADQFDQSSKIAYRYI